MDVGQIFTRDIKHIRQIDNPILRIRIIKDYIEHHKNEKHCPKSIYTPDENQHFINLYNACLMMELGM